MQIRLPEEVKNIINELNRAGFEAYAVGGCVRDSLLGRTPKDWDITTSAEPLEVKRIFRRTIDTGMKHGTVTVMRKNTGYEVTTYRVDGAYADHRRPESVTFTRRLSEDLLRRDFTINAMAYSEGDGLVDLYGGVSDLEKKIIRCVGDPDARFGEDALRIMRAVRFSAELDFTIEPATREAAAKHAAELSEISMERIETELRKTLLSDHPEKLIDMSELGMTAVFLPEFDRLLATPQNTPYHMYDAGRHTVEVIRNVSKTKEMRYSALFHDIAKPDTRTTDEQGIDHFKGHPALGAEMAEPILKRLRLDNDTIQTVKKMTYWHDFGIKGDFGEKAFRRMLSKLGSEYFDRLMDLKQADMLGQSTYHREEALKIMQCLRELKRQTDERGAALSIKALKINGKRLQELGIPAGPEMGRILNLLLEEVLEEPERNTPEWLENRVALLLHAGGYDIGRGEKTD